ncbi:hypothetical protein C9I56_41870 [Paraburkholderia caribensis]|nr:hypothetical protein C9I56_41870 [Paraburkholderia caribensis]
MRRWLQAGFIDEGTLFETSSLCKRGKVQTCSQQRPTQRRPLCRLRISANVTADFENVTDSAGFGIARC